MQFRDRRVFRVNLDDGTCAVTPYSSTDPRFDMFGMAFAGTGAGHGDEVLYVLDGTLHVRAWHGDQTYVFELGAADAVYLPQGARHEYRNYGAAAVSAILGVAPSYLASGGITGSTAANTSSWVTKLISRSSW